MEMDKIDAYPSFYDLVSARYSCRAYTSAPVSRDMILAVLDAARLAPSACNRQPWRFVVLDDEATRSKVLEAYPRDWARMAPVLIVACGEHSEAWHRGCDGKDHTDVDVAIAVEHICLAASSLGLGTCWICNFDPQPVRDALNLPDGLEPIALIPVGYPDPAAPVAPKKRKPFDETVRWGKF